MDCYQKAVSGIVVGSVGVFLVGEAFHAGEDPPRGAQAGRAGLQPLRRGDPPGSPRARR